ncbi:MAG: 1-deoxy-D-xylulose-5-phosphate reductoisomerase [Opitutales bacterium]|nr:1-deoxy-D-xylulose-5-phosphate reductoisomerase [Opitutales bacterium]MCH8540474.1 1-deoxy-D-xylulose-5-phosphate reductoisomerase [Opitutales bacterium]
MADLRKVVLLGATGSIGASACEVLRANAEHLQLEGVACRENARALAEICREFKVPHAGVMDPAAAAAARRENLFPEGTTLHEGAEGLSTLATLPAVDTVLVSIVGTGGLAPTLAAIEAGKTIALASKEVLVMAGDFVQAALRKSKSRLLPVDSEHNALFQCLENRPPEEVGRVILTASGGAFRDRPLETFSSITPEEATAHPTWTMGRKITVDSATMANKGLEVIEAAHLFGLAAEQIEVVIHPQSILHGLVEWSDGSLLAQLSEPSMTFAIQHCLRYPERGGRAGPKLSWQEAISLEMRPLDPQRYPALGLAYDALRQGGTGPAIFNAANEVAVEAFLDGRCRFPEIVRIIEHTLQKVNSSPAGSLAELAERDREARALAGEWVTRKFA